MTGRELFEHLSNQELTEAGHDNWWGLYVGGKMYTQGHEVDWFGIFTKLFPHLKQVEVDDEWLVGRGDLPESQAEIVHSED